MGFRSLALAIASILCASCTHGTLIASPGSTVQTCDESCLNEIVDTYLAALLAHDTKRLPTTSDVRFTENSIALPLGEGLWTTISALKAYKHTIPDPQDGQVGFSAAIAENSDAALLTGRMKIVDRKVAELETIVVRGGSSGLFMGTDDLAVQPGFLETVPAGKRASRADLVKAADLYFDGIEQGNGDIVPFSDACRRLSNGVVAAGAGARPLTLKLANGKSWSVPTGCRASINSKAFSHITRIDHRRFPVVDVSRGVVMAFAIFQHEGNVAFIDVPGVGRVPTFPQAMHPSASEVVEMFEIKDGKIRAIEAYSTLLPYGSGTGWN